MSIHPNFSMLFLCLDIMQAHYHLGGTGEATEASKFPVYCNRPGPTRTVLHIHMSTLGKCRRLLAADSLDMEPSVERQDRWERAAKLGHFGETLVVVYFAALGYNLWNTLDNQRILKFSEADVLHAGHHDGDIQHGNEVHNLDTKPDLPFLAFWKVRRGPGPRVRLPPHATDKEMPNRKASVTLWFREFYYPACPGVIVQTTSLDNLQNLGVRTPLNMSPARPRFLLAHTL